MDAFEEWLTVAHKRTSRYTERMHQDMREAWQAAKCPYVVTTDEGTSYCELAAGNGRDFDALVEALELCLVQLSADNVRNARALLSRIKSENDDE